MNKKKYEEISTLVSQISFSCFVFPLFPCSSFERAVTFLQCFYLSIHSRSLSSPPPPPPTLPPLSLSLSLSLCLSVSVAVSLSLSLSLCLSLSLSLSLSLPIYLSICLSMYFFLYQFVSSFAFLHLSCLTAGEFCKNPSVFCFFFLLFNN